ncbi:MAG TPA: hypothetical protein VGU72_17490 [Beijerinckiaceae bacterium]|jgi:hypothetical protein|nr:hypothetical protein [Beijerinckiaceae bacterium]
MSVPAPTAWAVDVPDVDPEDAPEPEEGPNDCRSGKLEDWLLEDRLLADELEDEPAVCP